MSTPRVYESAVSPWFQPMRAFFRVLACISLHAVAGAGEPPTDVAGLFQSVENLVIVRSPDKVEAATLTQGRLWFTRDERKRKHKEGRRAPVPPDQVVALSTILTQNSTYDWDSFKACMPIWNARLIFSRGGHNLSADFCFGCDIVVYAKDGKPFAGGNFDHGSDQIFSVIQALFPKDDVVIEIVETKKRQTEERALIQRLKEKEKRANQFPKPTSRLAPSRDAP
jgi:hypothetical protein